MSMEVFEMPIPRAYNDGRPVPQSVRERFEQAIVDQVGGYTVIPVRGAWADGNGQVYRDESDLYVIAVDREGADSVIEGLAHLAVELFEQESVFYTVAPKEARFVDRQRLAA
jgi:hypothetical protein